VRVPATVISTIEYLGSTNQAGRCMATRAIRLRRHSAVFQAAVILGASVVLGVSGCAHRRIYRASELPARFAPPSPQDVNAALVSGRLTPPCSASSELITAGDLLDVTIDDGFGEQPAKTSSVWVEEDGTTRIPLIGTVAVAGLTLHEAGRVIAREGVRSGLYRDPYPYVTVEMKRRRMNRVTVMGAVATPGVVHLPRSSSYLLAALVAAGNLTENAGPEVEIRRAARPRGAPHLIPPHSPHTADGPQAELTSYGHSGPQAPQTIRVNLVSAGQADQESYYLEDGDVVVVGERKPGSICVMGLVEKPDEYELPTDREFRVLEALALAGGRKSQLADKVCIVRHPPDEEEPIEIRVSVREAKRNGAANVKLAAGDVVSVEETPATFTIEMLRNFVRFGLSSSIPLF